MRRQSFAFCCCFTLLFVASSSKPREDSTTGDERNNSTVRYEVHANVITTNRSDDAKAVHYDMHKNSTRNNVQHEFRGNFISDVHDNGSMQYEFHSTKAHGDGDQAPAEFRVVNSTRVDNESNSTSHIEPSENLMQVENRSNLTTYEHLGKLSQDDNRNVVPYEMCENSTCIPLCCPLGSRMVGEKNCTEENANYLFPDVYEFDFGTNQSIPIGKKVDQVFQLSHHDPCGSRGRYLLVPNEMPHDVYRFLVNGSLYLPYKMKFIDSYCLIPWTSNKYEIAVCFEKEELSENLMQADGSNLTSYAQLGKLFQDDNRNVVPYEMCENSTCIPLCCPLGNRMVEEKCIKTNGSYLFPDVYEFDFDTNQSIPIGKKVDQVFQLSHHDPCGPPGRYLLFPNKMPHDVYRFLVNGSLYQPHWMTFIDSYCLLAWNSNEYQIAVCYEEELPVPEKDPPPSVHIGYPVGLLISLPFLLSTFIVYSILPELWNMHGYTLRGYIGSLFVAYIFLAVHQLADQKKISDTFCIISAFIIHFSFLASFFWLNVMCFDIWWTFGGFRSLQGSVTQRERKKFLMYSIYAWGSASILTIICAIMDFVPSVPKELIRPEIGATKCWFNTDEARAIYFYGPMGVTVICNICLFISTALKIIRHQRDTAHHLRSSESRRHDDNKQWFNLYLKLFIVMGINWSMEIISWLFKTEPAYIWYLSDLTNTLQGLIIFFIFVWKAKIKRLLLKRFGCQDRGLFSRNSTRSGNHSTASRTCTTTSGVMSLQEKVNPYVQTNCRAKSSSDEAD